MSCQMKAYSAFLGGLIKNGFPDLDLEAGTGNNYRTQTPISKMCAIIPRTYPTVYMVQTSDIYSISAPRTYPTVYMVKKICVPGIHGIHIHMISIGWVDG